MELIRRYNEPLGNRYRKTVEAG